MTIEIAAKIKGVTYQPTLCAELQKFSIADLDQALELSASLCQLDQSHTIAISKWVSPKRSRSAPFARIYNTLGFDGKKATIIPLVKDEGKGGDYDYLQWDTVALMGLLGVYVILGYYLTAEAKPGFDNKITNQGFDKNLIAERLEALRNYHSSALHWNLEQFEKVPEVGNFAVEAYQRIGMELGVQMHNPASMQGWISRAKASKDEFLAMSRQRARNAQLREASSVQPREVNLGRKGSITIEDLVGGHYHLTADNCVFEGRLIRLTESKHVQGDKLPSSDHVKEGLVKMALFCNLTSATVSGEDFQCVPVLRLSRGDRSLPLNESNEIRLNSLMIEARMNNFILDVSALL